MKRDPGGPQLSAVFVDYDNIYLSLKRKNEDAAKRFSKDAAVWAKALEKGQLIRSDAHAADAPRRMVLSRCYGNPVPRRNSADNTTDMNSFPFVRHHFLRAGFEVVDCPPLTSHQKNAADIRMVMDLRDYLTHPTYFDEFIILSGDADFTPVLHRLRQHARRTIIYSNDHTAAAYAAICDGEVREADLIKLLLGDTAEQETNVVAHGTPLSAPALPAQVPVVALTPAPVASPVHEPAARPAAQLRLEDLRQLIMTEVVNGIRAASGPVPLEALADRAIRTLGHERTVGTAWAGAGSFRELMRIALPTDLRLTEQPPFQAYDPLRHLAAAPAPAPQPQLQPQPQPAALAPQRPAAPPPLPQQAASLVQQREALAAAMAELTQTEPEEPRASRYAQVRPSAGPQPRQAPVQPDGPQPAALASRPATADQLMHRGSVRAPAPTPAPRAEAPSSAQLAMARIQEASQAPALSAADYRIVFMVMAQEIGENGLTGSQTLTAVAERAEAHGVMLRKEDIRFVLDVVSEPDPWFEQGASASLFAGRFRNFVVARCRDHGLQLSSKDLDLIDAWVMAVAAPSPSRGFAAESARQPAPTAPPPAAAPAQAAPTAQRDSGGGRWWSQGEGESPRDGGEDDFPRIVRTRRA